MASSAITGTNSEKLDTVAQRIIGLETTIRIWTWLVGVMLSFVVGGIAFLYNHSEKLHEQNTALINRFQEQNTAALAKFQEQNTATFTKLQEQNTSILAELRGLSVQIGHVREAQVEAARELKEHRDRITKLEAAGGKKP